MEAPGQYSLDAIIYAKFHLGMIFSLSAVIELNEVNTHFHIGPASIDPST